jgi:hypothetical protein
MHPVLVAALAGYRHRRCPRGGVTQQPYRLCRNCRHGQRLEMQGDATASSPHSMLRARDIPKARPLAWMLSLLRITSKGTRG